MKNRANRLNKSARFHNFGDINSKLSPCESSAIFNHFEKTMLSSINSLTSAEMELFEKFISSPYFNSRSKITLLFKFLASKYPAITPADIDKHNISKLLYPGSRYNDEKVRRVISDFVQIYEQFLAYCEIGKVDRGYIDSLLLEALFKRGLYSRFERHFKSLEKLTLREFDKDDAFYRNMARNYFLHCFHSSDLGNNSQFQSDIINTSRNMDMQFVFSKLHLYREILINRKQSAKLSKIELSFLEPVMQYVRENVNELKAEHPNIYVIYLSIMITLNGDEKDLDEMVNYISLNRGKFSRETLNYYYSYIVSEFWMKYNGGLEIYSERIFEVYDTMIRLEVFKMERYINPAWINNAINIALVNNKTNWAETFLAKFKNDIEPVSFDTCYNLSMARILFSKAQFESSLQYCMKVDFSDPYYFINSKILSMKNLYESGDIERMEYVIDSLNKYSKRNLKLVRFQKELIKLTTKYFGLLVKIRLKDPDKVIILKNELTKNRSYFPNRSWLLEKLDETENLFPNRHKNRKSRK